jgi:hypothetical protein
VAVVFGDRGPTVIAIYTNGTEDGTGQVFGETVTRMLLHPANPQVEG